MSLLDYFFSAGVQKDSNDRWIFSSSSPSSTNEPVVEPGMSLESDVTQSESELPPSPDNVVSNALTLDNNDTQPTTSKGKKKRPKKKKSANELVHHVTWGTVEELCFNRTISYSSVPNKGIYPLGLGELEETNNYTVDEYFMKQQLILLERSKVCGVSAPSNKTHAPQSSPPAPSAGLKSLGSPSGSPQGSPHNNLKGKKTLSKPNTDKIIPPQPPVTASVAVAGASGPLTTYMATLFETRQFDYKANCINPLFRITSEDERLSKLMSHKADWNKLVDSNKDHGVLDASTQQHHSIAELLNREIKSIKHSRDEGAGCNCKHVKVDKLSVAKMKTELATHGHLIQYAGNKNDIEALKKTDLTSKVKEIIALCPLCTENNCECVQQGVQCSNNICSCVRGNTGGIIRPDGHLAQTCANPEGFSVFDQESVAQYRKKFLLDLKDKRD